VNAIGRPATTTEYTLAPWINGAIADSAPPTLDVILLYHNAAALREGEN
jgi:hypothetical protein